MNALQRLITAAVLTAATLVVTPVHGDQKPLDLNQATVEQLESLSGIGASKARAIVSYREEHGPFRNVDELRDVKGIGDKLLAALKPQLIVSAPPAAAGGKAAH